MSFTYYNDGMNELRRIDKEAGKAEVYLGGGKWKPIPLNIAVTDTWTGEFYPTPSAEVDSVIAAIDAKRAR